ncbi:MULTISPECIES: DUF1971 domain-containing protein [Shewanella]|uniref:DUF1971 domain-containing protein n=1 Tax=Shewanella TaxID=22 RepID=UPI001C65E3FE|nr:MULTISPECIES: DUF1971 domain-containing protein [Shewanella]QYJ74559.1 DUF1971 domain-containing protein [Shewanella sp. FJAT-52076]QYK04432.1 DUF1971 domain-containing protein [Shewanella zhangzhouensis]
MALIPKNYVPVGSTRIFGGNDIPELLLSQHRTRNGFYSQIEVVEGELLWQGFGDTDGKPGIEVHLRANDRAMTHPGKCYCVKLLTDDTRFRLNVFAHESLQESNVDVSSTVGLFLEPLDPEPTPVTKQTEDTDCELQADR